MPIFITLFSISLITLIIVLFLFLIFKLTTVRRLSKNPETQDSLGFQLVSGWNTLHVAKALALPQFLLNRLKKSRHTSPFADTDLIRKHTNKKDARLAKIFYWTSFTWMIYTAIISLLFQFGFFE